MLTLDCAAQRLLILALRNQIDTWKSRARSKDLSEDEKIDIQNDIGYAHTVLSALETSFFKEFGFNAS